MQGQATPNPKVRRFSVAWSGEGEHLPGEPGFAALWAVDGVCSVLLGDGTCSVTLDGPWSQAIADAVSCALGRCTPPERPVRSEARVGPPTLRDKVEAILDFELRPAIAAHGGSVELVDVGEGVVTVRLRGACRSCPSSANTLQGQVLAGLRRWLPEIEAVREADA